MISAGLHLSGLTHAVLPPTLIAMVQVVIGISVGVRFTATSLAEVGQTLPMATLQAVMLLIAILAARGIHALTGVSLPAGLLAYMSGGASELSLVALSLGIDPAFVTSHHLLRITVLILVLPVLYKYFQRVQA